MINLLVIFLLWFGGFFLFVAAVGLLLLPDVFQRMHAMTKAGTLGVASLVLGVAIYFGDVGTTLPAVLIIGFFIITAPIAGHMIGRAAYHRQSFNPADCVVDEYANTAASQPETDAAKPKTAQATEVPAADA